MDLIVEQKIEVTFSACVCILIVLMLCRDNHNGYS